MAMQHEAIVKRTSGYTVNPRAIKRRDDWNPRFDFGEIEELAKSIRENGILNPLRVKRFDDKQFELIDGDRRLTAIEHLIAAGHEFSDGIPVVIVDRNQDDVTSLIQMFEANTGKPFLPLEEAAAYKRMRDSGLTIMDIKARVGRSDTHITATLALLDATPELQAAVKEGAVPPTLARNIAVHARGNAEKQKELVGKAKTAGRDRKKLREVQAEVETARVEKNAAKGRAVKSPTLSAAVLGELEEKHVKALLELAAQHGWKSSLNGIRGQVIADDNFVVAFKLGVVLALQHAQGKKSNIDV